MPDLPKFVRDRMAAALTPTSPNRASTPASQEPARWGQHAGAAGEHPDADLLNAFCENALLPAERVRMLAHLAACAVCREVVALSAAAEAAPGPAPALPRRKRFAFPVLRWSALAAAMAVVLGVVLLHRPQLRTFAPEGVVVSQRAVAGPAQVPGAPANAAENPQAAEAKTAPGHAAGMLASRSAGLQTGGPPAKAVPEPIVGMPAEQEKAMSAERKPAPKEDLGAQPAGATLTSRVRPGPAEGPAVAGVVGLPEPRQQYAPGLNAARTIVPPADSEQELKAHARANPPVPASPPQRAKSGRVGDSGQAAGAAAELALAEAVPLKKGFSTGRENDVLGTVTDASGAVITNAQVTLRNLGTSEERATATDTQGHYAINMLPEGHYSLNVRKPGFKDYQVADVSLSRGDRAINDARLEVGGAAEAVAVQAQVAEVQTDTARAGALIAPRQMQGLALNGRNFSDLLALAPGVSASGAWSISSKGQVMRAEAGSPPQIVTVAPDLTFRAVTAAGTEIWAGANGGVLYHSSDGGASWTRVEFPSNQAIVAIRFDSLAEGTATTADGREYVTHDAGRSWSREE